MTEKDGHKCRWEQWEKQTQIGAKGYSNIDGDTETIKREIIRKRDDKRKLNRGGKVNRDKEKILQNLISSLTCLTVQNGSLDCCTVLNQTHRSNANIFGEMKRKDFEEIKD